jgi:hypothetical protein
MSFWGGVKLPTSNYRIIANENKGDLALRFPISEIDPCTATALEASRKKPPSKIIEACRKKPPSKIIKACRKKQQAKIIEACRKKP